MENVVIELPQDVEDIIATLEGAGYDAYVVGGCVRDSLLGRKPGDWDITTSAMPEQVKSLFKRTIDTGIKHGTVTIMIGKTGYEVTTYRIDGEYEDGRHPKSVEFSRSLIDDLKRRDFTINAMAYNKNTGIVDEFNGMYDLQNKVIKCVGTAKHRFSEDALRMMRAIRFSAQLGFLIEEHTFRAILELSETINKVSRERIHVELNKILLSDNPGHVQYLYEAGLTKEILPVIHNIFASNKKIPTLSMLKHAKNNLVLRYAALLYYADEQAAQTTLKDLKLDNCTVNTVAKLVKCERLGIEENEPAVREAIYKYGREFIPLMITHHSSALQAKQECTGIMMTSGRHHIDIIQRIYNDVTQRGDCISVKELDITGNDLIEYGITGQKIGETLNELLHIVMENPKLNDKATLLAMIEHKE